MQIDILGAMLNERVEGAGVDVVELDRLKGRQLRLPLPTLEHCVL